MVQKSYWEANSSWASPGCPHIFWTAKFITIFTTADHLTLSSARWMQSTRPHWRSTLILSSYLLVYLPRSFFLSRFPLKSRTYLFAPSPPLMTFLIHHRLVTQQIFHLNGVSSWISLLHNFLQPPYTSSFLGLCGFLSNLFSHAFTQWRFLTRGFE